MSIKYYELSALLITKLDPATVERLASLIEHMDPEVFSNLIRAIRVSPSGEMSISPVLLKKILSKGKC